LTEELPVIPNGDAHIIRLVKCDSAYDEFSGIDYRIRVKIDGKYYNGTLELSE